MSTPVALLILLTCAVSSPAAHGRTWTDSTGKYQTEADLVAFSDEMVVLKKSDQQLVAIPLDKLSKADQQYVKSKDANEYMLRSAEKMQTWTMQSGMKVNGKVVDYGRREVSIARRRGKIYVNNQLYDNLPKVYQEMIPKIVAHFEKTEVKGKAGLEAWVLKQRGEAKTFTVEGVILELENGDEYGMPFFLFSSEDLRVLQPGWQRWLAATKTPDPADDRQQSFMLQSAARAYQQNQAANQQIAMMQLDLLAADTGLVDLWEVRLFPRPGAASPPLSVIVPGRDSRSASQEAMRRYPGYTIGPVSRASRR